MKVSELITALQAIENQNQDIIFSAFTDGSQALLRWDLTSINNSVDPEYPDNIQIEFMLESL